MMKLFELTKRKHLPVIPPHEIQKRPDEREINLAVRRLAEFCLSLLTRAKEKPSGCVLPMLSKRMVIDPGIRFPKPYRNEY